MKKEIIHIRPCKATGHTTLCETDGTVTDYIALATCGECMYKATNANINAVRFGEQTPYK